MSQTRLSHLNVAVSGVDHLVELTVTDHRTQVLVKLPVSVQTDVRQCRT